ncbi:MAG: response regulator [Verrucomicrobiales bacterium]|nr:response regulator [Verrucomicrobiales bacterium]
MSKPSPSPAPHGRNWPLWQQIGLALALATLLVSVLTGEMVRHFEKRYLDNDLVLQTQRVFSTLSAASMDAVIARDREVLKGVIETIVTHDADIVSFAIADSRGRELVSWSRSITNAEIRSFSDQLVHEGEKFGNMTVQWDIARRQQPIDSHVLRMRLLVFLSLLILSVVILASLDIFILRPIRRLSRRLIDRQEEGLQEQSSRFAAREIVSLHKVLSERLQTEEALEFTRFYIDNAGDPTFWITRDGSFFYANEGALKLLGCTRDRLPALRVTRVFPAFDQDSWKDFWAGLPGADTFTLDCRCRRSDGTEFPANTTINYLEYQGQAYCCAFVRDVTERRLAEEALRRAHDELDVRVQERTRELQLEITERKAAQRVSQMAREAAEAANAAKSDFLATMSHEIRTPMNAVLGFANILLSTRLDEEQLDFVQTIRSSGESLLALINDILDFSKIEAGHLQLERIPIDFGQIVEEVCSLLSAKSEEKRIELALYCDPALPRECLGDPMRVRQILLNLIGNALKFTEQGHVFVEVSFLRVPTAESREAYSVKFSISDTGIGIDPAKQRLLFRKFQQMDSSTTRKFGGTGLGLAICRLLVECMGGTIEVESEVGKGSTFSVTLPVDSPRLDLLRVSEPSVGPGRKRILILDRALINRKVLHRQFVRWGIECECVDRFSDALSTLRTAQAFGDPFDVVFVEMTLGERDGMQFAQEVRREGSISGTGLILLVTGNQRGDTSVFSSRGFAGSLLKPLVRQQALVEALRKGLEQRSRLLAEVADRSPSQPQIPAAPARTEPLLPASDLVRPVTPTSEAQSSAAPPADVSGTRSSKLERLDAKILLVEDNDVNLKLARRLLEKMGCRIVAAVNGKEAVDHAQIEVFDLVLMDCQMPEMDGFEATRELRRLESQGFLPASDQGRLPIVALTANAVQGDRDRCLEAGMDDYVTKPVSAEELHAAVRKWIRPSRSRFTSY